MKLFKIVSGVLFVLITSSCTTVELIGKLNMLSNRNVNIGETNYILLAPYQGASQKLIKRSKYRSLEEAADATVKQTPGGEFLTNVKVWQINGQYYAVEGDVWGLQEHDGDGVIEAMRGFKVKDRVQYKKRTGIIISIIDAEECLVQLEGNDYGTRLSYDDLVKLDIQIEPDHGVDIVTENFRVGDHVRFESKKYVPVETFIGKVIEVNNSERKLVVQYTKNGKNKVETIPFHKVIGN